MNRIKSVLFTSVLVLAVALGAVPSFAAPPGLTLVDVALAVNSEGMYAGMFDTLIAAVVSQPAILSTLSGNGQFTVFAPTDDAFLALGITPENVAGVPNLANILLYHVARGRRYAEDVVMSEQIRTLQRGFVMQDMGTLKGYSNTTWVNIIVTDVEAANGIIHVIDGVLLP
ncbi:MAG: fasciclin domain-containing protein [Anaerolineae bacterium]|nr:fasciclin domain-containing protein [Anaerolineae bacterium]